MTLCLCWDNEHLALAASELRCARLLCIEMVKARLSADKLTSLRDLESLCV